MKTLSQCRTELLELGRRLGYPYDPSLFETWLTDVHRTHQICMGVENRFGERGIALIAEVEGSLEGSALGTFQIRKSLTEFQDVFNVLKLKLIAFDGDANVTKSKPQRVPFFRVH